MSLPVFSLLMLGSLIAGWVDAVVGGGGLILIPLVMILNPGFSNAQALGANKVAAIFGTGSSAIVLTRKYPSALKSLRYGPLAFAGAAFGAFIASSVEKDFMRPIIIFLLVVVGIFVLLRPSFGQDFRGNKSVTRKHFCGAIVLMAGISVYDGVFGPGTGMFLIIGLTSLLQQDFIASAAWAKVINVFTNLGALVAFAVQGEVLWFLGLSLAVANVVGAQIGVRMVLGRGAAFIRVAILVVVVIMAGKLLYDQLFAMG